MRGRNTNTSSPRHSTRKGSLSVSNLTPSGCFRIIGMSLSSLTPGPPALFKDMNWTPAFARAFCKALVWVDATSRRPASKSLIVKRLTPDDLARFSCDQSISARAARIWEGRIDLTLRASNAASVYVSNFFVSTKKWQHHTASMWIVRHRSRTTLVLGLGWCNMLWRNGHSADAGVSVLDRHFRQQVAHCRFVCAGRPARSRGCESPTMKE